MYSPQQHFSVPSPNSPSVDEICAPRGADTPFPHRGKAEREREHHKKSRVEKKRKEKKKKKSASPLHTHSRCQQATSEQVRGSHQTVHVTTVRRSSGKYLKNLNTKFAVQPRNASWVNLASRADTPLLFQMHSRVLFINGTKPLSFIFQSVLFEQHARIIFCFALTQRIAISRLHTWFFPRAHSSRVGLLSSRIVQQNILETLKRTMLQTNTHIEPPPCLYTQNTLKTDFWFFLFPFSVCAIILTRTIVALSTNLANAHTSPSSIYKHKTYHCISTTSESGSK